MLFCISKKYKKYGLTFSITTTFLKKCGCDREYFKNVVVVENILGLYLHFLKKKKKITLES